MNVLSLCSGYGGLDLAIGTDLVPNRAALGMLGNGVCPPQAELAFRLLLDDNGNR